MPQANLPLPGWVGVLQAAEAWGCPPWEVTGEQPTNRLLWMMRRGAYEGEVARAARNRKKGKRG